MLKTTMIVVIFVCPSIRPHETTRLTLNRFSCNLSIFRKSVENFQNSLKSDKNSDNLHKANHKFLIISRSIILRMRNVSNKYCVQY